MVIHSIKEITTFFRSYFLYILFLLFSFLLTPWSDSDDELARAIDINTRLLFRSGVWLIPVKMWSNCVIETLLTPI